MTTSTEPNARAGAAAAALAIVPQLAAAEPQHDLDGRFAASNLALLRDAGLLATNVPAELGGFGEQLAGTLDVIRIVAHGSPSTALMLMMHTSVLANYLLDPNEVPADQRVSFAEQARWAFSEAAAGKVFGVANSEAGAGGDVRRSRAEIRDGRLYGVKSFCSIGTNAHYYMAAARDQSGTVEYYLVANGQDTVSVASPWNAMGMRSSESVSLRFEGARVVGPLAFRGLIDGPNNRHWSTLSFAAVFIGIAESLLDDLTGNPDGILQKTTAVDLHLGLQASRAFMAQCVAVESQPTTNAAYRALVRDCKVFVTRTLAQHASAAFGAQSGSAYRAASSISRKLRDLMAGPAVRPPVGMSFDEIWEGLTADQREVRPTAAGHRQEGPVPRGRVVRERRE